MDKKRHSPHYDDVDESNKFKKLRLNQVEEDELIWDDWEDLDESMISELKRLLHK